MDYSFNADMREVYKRLALEHPSATQLAERFCHDMIDTLRHNVGEQKKRQEDGVKKEQDYKTGD